MAPSSCFGDWPKVRPAMDTALPGMSLGGEIWAGIIDPSVDCR